MSIHHLLRETSGHDGHVECEIMYKKANNIEKGVMKYEKMVR